MKLCPRAFAPGSLGRDLIERNANNFGRIGHDLFVAVAIDGSEKVIGASVYERKVYNATRELDVRIERINQEVCKTLIQELKGEIQVASGR